MSNNNKRFDARKIIRLILILGIAALLFAQVFKQRSDITLQGPLLSKILMATGVVLLIVTIARIVFRNSAKRTQKKDNYNLINTQFSKVMRQLNGVKRTLPQMSDRIFDDETAEAEKELLRKLLVENPLQEISEVKEKQPEFYSEYSAYIREALVVIDKCKSTSDTVRAMMDELCIETEIFSKYAMRIRALYLEQ